MWNKDVNRIDVDILNVNCEDQEGIEKNYRLKPYWGNPTVRNFRGGAGDMDYGGIRNLLHKRKCG